MNKVFKNEESKKEYVEKMLASLDALKSVISITESKIRLSDQNVDKLIEALDHYNDCMYLLSCVGQKIGEDCTILSEQYPSYDERYQAEHMFMDNYAENHSIGFQEIWGPYLRTMQADKKEKISKELFKIYLERDYNNQEERQNHSTK